MLKAFDYVAEAKGSGPQRAAEFADLLGVPPPMRIWKFNHKELTAMVGSAVSGVLNFLGAGAALREQYDQAVEMWNKHSADLVEGEDWWLNPGWNADTITGEDRWSAEFVQPALDAFVVPVGTPANVVPRLQELLEVQNSEDVYTLALYKVSTQDLAYALNKAGIDDDSDPTGVFRGSFLGELDRLMSTSDSD